MTTKARYNGNQDNFGTPHDVIVFVGGAFRRSIINSNAQCRIFGLDYSRTVTKKHLFMACIVYTVGGSNSTWTPHLPFHTVHIGGTCSADEARTRKCIM